MKKQKPQKSQKPINIPKPVEEYGVQTILPSQMKIDKRKRPR